MTNDFLEECTKEVSIRLNRHYVQAEIYKWNYTFDIEIPSYHIRTQMTVYVEDKDLETDEDRLNRAWKQLADVLAVFSKKAEEEVC